MRTTILAAAVAFVTGAAAGGALLAEAQPAPPPAVMLDKGPAAGRPDRMRGMGMYGHRRPGPATFSLLYTSQDRQLTPADVTKIAEAALLWHGNHTWKVVDVTATPDGPIGFGLASPDGSVIARFTMDPHTGRVTRTA